MSTAEAKLTKLKVADLKNILAKVSKPHSGLKKPELIAAILASPEALKAAGMEVEAPAATASTEIDEYDMSPVASQPPAVEKAAPTPVAKPVEATPAPQPTSSTTAVSPAVVAQTAGAVPAFALPDPKTLNPQDDLERRKARAARFGIPLVDELKKTAPAPAAATTSKSTTKVAKASEPKPAVTKPPPDDVEKLRQRAARFGLNTNPPKDAAAPKAPAAAKKAPAAAAPPVELDPVEEEKKRKRAEKFGAVQAPAEKKVKTSV